MLISSSSHHLIILPHLMQHLISFAFADQRLDSENRENHRLVRLVCLESRPDLSKHTLLIARGLCVPLISLLSHAASSGLLATSHWLLCSVRDNQGPLPECKIVDGVGHAWRCSWP
jgi:hypothetical protein